MRRNIVYAIGMLFWALCSAVLAFFAYQAYPAHPQAFYVLLAAAALGLFSILGFFYFLAQEPEEDLTPPPPPPPHHTPWF